ncbi:MAG TPA: glycosyltransferase family 4 protein [Candidatus Angelobacter sp.]
MKIALVAPPFIAVPPRKYGGTELFVAELAKGLQARGIEVVLYANGASTAPVETRWIYEKEDWPIAGAVEASLKALSHSCWAVKDASREADLIHLNSAPGISYSHFVSQPFVYTVHHAFEQALTDYYRTLPDVYYVTISDFQRRQLPMQHMRTIHHGVDFNLYTMGTGKRSYLAFLGRLAPTKGTHLAIEIAQQAGIPLKIAGEIQPLYKEYWEKQVKPHVDGKLIQYIGEVGPTEKAELLGNATAMLFPIQWNEPFGLVMIEAMACGTPVLAMPGGSVEEIVKEGVGGHVRRSVKELADCARNLALDVQAVRAYAEQNFSVERMIDNYIQLYSDILTDRQTGVDAERIVA